MNASVPVMGATATTYDWTEQRWWAGLTREARFWCPLRGWTADYKNCLRDNSFLLPWEGTY